MTSTINNRAAAKAKLLAKVRRGRPSQQPAPPEENTIPFHLMADWRTCYATDAEHLKRLIGHDTFALWIANQPHLYQLTGADENEWRQLSLAVCGFTYFALTAQPQPSAPTTSDYTMGDFAIDLEAQTAQATQALIHAEAVGDAPRVALAAAWLTKLANY